MLKNIVLASLLALSMTSAQAGLWDSLSGAFKETIEAKAAYTVEASGSNIRVYEWETPTGKHCILAATSNSSSLQCF